MPSYTKHTLLLSIGKYLFKSCSWTQSRSADYSFFALPHSGRTSEHARSWHRFARPFYCRLARTIFRSIQSRAPFKWRRVQTDGWISRPRIPSRPTQPRNSPSDFNPHVDEPSPGLWDRRRSSSPRAHSEIPSDVKRTIVIAHLFLPHDISTNDRCNRFTF